jgi:DNA-binding NarL/FixJ family response regulator
MTGIEAAQALRPDVVLLDVRLPDRDGFDCATVLTADGYRPTVIITSSSDDPLYPDRALRCGATGFLAKHDVCGAALDRLID